MKNTKELHYLLKQLAEKLNEEQGVTIESVRFDWIRQMNGTAHLAGCHLDTATE